MRNILAVIFVLVFFTVSVCAQYPSSFDDPAWSDESWYRGNWDSDNYMIDVPSIFELRYYHSSTPSYYIFPVGTSNSGNPANVRFVPAISFSNGGARYQNSDTSSLRVGAGSIFQNYCECLLSNRGVSYGYFYIKFLKNGLGTSGVSSELSETVLDDTVVVLVLSGNGGISGGPMLYKKATIPVHLQSVTYTTVGLGVNLKEYVYGVKYVLSFKVPLNVSVLNAILRGEYDDPDDDGDGDDDEEDDEENECECGACCECRCTCGHWTGPGCLLFCSHICESLPGTVCDIHGEGDSEYLMRCCDCHCECDGDGGDGNGDGGDGNGDGDGDGGDGNGDGDGDEDEDDVPVFPLGDSLPPLPDFPIFDPPPYSFPEGGVEIPSRISEGLNDLRDEFSRKLGLGTFFEMMRPREGGLWCLTVVIPLKQFSDLANWGGGQKEDFDDIEVKYCLSELAQQEWVPYVRKGVLFMVVCMFVSAVVTTLRQY